MINLFQPLDLRVNGSTKAYMKRRFTEWYSTSISCQLDKGKAVDDTEVELKLSFLKFLRTGWIHDLYDYLTSEEGGYLKWLESRFHYWSHWKRLKTTRSSQSFLWGQSFDQWSEWMFEVIPTIHYISSFATWSIDDYEAEWECKREPSFSKYLTTLNKIIWNLFSKRTTVIETFFLYSFFISFIEKNPLTVYRKSYIRKFYWLWAIRKN